MDRARNVFATEKAEKGFLPSGPMVWWNQGPFKGFWPSGVLLAVSNGLVRPKVWLEVLLTRL